jgi:hypothetical protein
MAATATIAIKMTVTPTTGNVTEVSRSFTSATAPAEVLWNQAVVGSDAFTLDLGDVAAGAGYLLWLRPIVGNFYFKLNGGASDTPILTDSHLYIKEGEAYVIPINPNATAMARIRGISDTATTGKIEYLLIGA